MSEGMTRRIFMGTVATGMTLGAAGLCLSPGNTFPQFGPILAYADEPKSISSATKRAINPYARPSVVAHSGKSVDPKRILVVVDYQVDFVDGGVFGRIEPAVAIEGALCDKIDEYRDAGDIIIYTMDSHPREGYYETREGQVNEIHCVPGEPGWEVYGRARERLTPENAYLVMKGTYGSGDLPLVIATLINQGAAVQSIEFAGVSTTCRVLHNAILCYNYFPELPLIFDDSTTASYTDERTIEQLDELESWGFIVRRTNAHLEEVRASYE